MKRARIILADTDENYIEPLEEKFLEELKGRIDLEVITSPEYFDRLFSTPQKADVLAVSEDLCREDLLRHGITSVFVLSENEERCRENAGPYVGIYKYSSLKEIFGRIMAFANLSLNSDHETRKETRIITVCSAVGGVGKTTVSLGIAACMAQNMKRVLYVNADRMNSFQRILRDSSPLPVYLYPQMSDPRSGVFDRIKQHIRNEKFDYLPPFGGALFSVNVDYGFYERFVREAAASGEYDTIVIDADVVIDEYKVSLLALSDRVIIVTAPAAGSVYATELFVENMNCSDNEKFYFICCGCSAGDYIPPGHRDRAPIIFDEYVSLIEDVEAMPVPALARVPDIQKISFMME